MNIKKKFRKDVIVCLHPSSDYQLYKKELSGLKVYKYKTERYIVKSFLEGTPYQSWYYFEIYEWQKKYVKNQLSSKNLEINLKPT